MTMHNALHPKSNVDRLYLPWKDGGRGLLGVEATVNIAKVSLKRYVNNCTERLLSSLRITEEGEVIESEADVKKRKRTERKENWKEKTLHGQFLRQTDDIAGEDRWLWLKQGNLKRETESLRTNKAQVIDFAIPYDSRVDSKEMEKIEKYQDLVRELKRLWDMKVVVIPIVLGALGTTPKTLQKRMKDIGIETRIGELQKTVIMHTARILRKVLEV